MDIVKLYYPNEWTNNINKLYNLDKDNHCDCDWNWFICSRKYYDTKHKTYVIEISPSVQFYCEKTGKSLQAERKEKSKLLLIDGPIKSIRTEFNKGIKKGFDGITFFKNTKKNTCDVICSKVMFAFKKGILTNVPSSDQCKIIRYAIQNNSYIRKSIKDFPTCKEINELLKVKKCNVVARMLYSEITR